MVINMSALEKEILSYVIGQFKDLCREKGSQSALIVEDIMTELYEGEGASILSVMHPFYHYVNTLSGKLSFSKQEFDIACYGFFETLKNMKNEEHGEAGKMADMPIILNALHRFSENMTEEDGYTAKHSDNVTKYCATIGKKMGIKNAHGLFIAAASHDTGKMFTPTWILNKPEKLTEEELRVMRVHSYHSAQLIKISSKLFDNEIIEGVLYHHTYFDSKDKYNGKSYPFLGKKPPIFAQIIALADSYDAMTTQRIYKTEKRTETDALIELRRCSGTQFNPDIVELFIQKEIYKEITH